MAAARKSPNTITLTCHFDNGLWNECIAKVVFTPDDTGFVVRFVACTDPPTDEVVHRSAEKLDWRSAARALLALDECEVNPEGCSVGATVTEPFAAVLLLRCWSRKISDDCAVGAFACTDEQLREHWGWASKRDPDPDAGEGAVGDHSSPGQRYLARLETIGDLIDRCGFTDLSVAEIAQRIDCAVDGPDTWPAFIAGMQSYAASIGLQRHIEENSDEYALTWLLLESLRKFPAPSRPDLVARVLYSWTVVAEKPRSDEYPGGFRTSSLWAYLAWLLAGSTEEKLRAFKAAHCEECGTFLGWLELQRKELLDQLADPQRGGGGAVGRAVGRAAAASHLRLCEEVLGAAQGI